MLRWGAFAGLILALVACSTPDETAPPVVTVLESAAATSTTVAPTTIATTIATTSTTTPPVTARLVGAGDIASSGSGDTATAELIRSLDPTAVFTLGDNAYPSGAASDFENFYEPTWGQFKAITHSTIGNHDILTANGDPYRSYFGVSNYYSYDLAGWHIVVLDGNVPSDRAQLAWLTADLANDASTCEMAMWHQPVSSSGSTHGSNSRELPFWDLLVADHADLVLNGHEHNYERFAPESGMTEIVVGTGGASHYSFETPKPGSLVRNSGTFGVLQLSLSPASAEYAFVPVAGETFTDSGTVSCS
jgi:hypothetical protein